MRMRALSRCKNSDHCVFKICYFNSSQMQSVAKSGYGTTDTHTQHGWIITPYLNPLPSSEIHFHHPDFYRVLQELKPLRGHITSSHSHGYPRGRFNNLSNAGGSNHTLQGLPRQNNVLSSPSSLLHSGSLQQVDSLQTPLSQSHMYQHQTSTSDRDLSYQQSTPPSSEQCNEYHVHHTSEVKLTPLPESDYHYTSNDAAQKSTKAQMSSKEQRIATSSTHQISGKQKHRRSDSKVLANCESGKLSVRKSTGGNKKQAKLVTTPSGSVQLSSRCEASERNTGAVYVDPQGCLDGGENTHNEQTVWRDVRSMTQGERDSTEKLFLSVDECGMTLIFSNESTQLRERKTKSTKQDVIEIDGLLVAAPTTPSENKSSLEFYFIPLDPRNHSQDEWCKTQLLGLLQHARVICYGGQEIFATIIKHYGLHSQADIWLEWCPLDVKVAVWLLDPDNVPNDFHHTLSRFNIQHSADSTHQACFDVTTCQDLSLLGPLMVQLYYRLQEHNLWSLFSEVETRLIPILGSMEAIGIQVNTDKLLHFAELLKLKIAQVETCAHKVAKRTFSINSTLQLRQVLFDELQLDKKCSKKLSKTHVLKHKSTSEAVLIQLQDLHPLPGLVLEYRQLCKIKATYITGILPYISEGVLHPCWQHTGAATGRLVSCSPNIQAFPKQAIDLGAVNKQFIVGKEEERQSVEVREAVVSRVGHSFVATDFRSIELRLLAHLSGDPALISILTTQPQSTSPDVFMHLAAQWLNVSVKSVTAGDRDRAKRVVYAIVYGVGKDKLAEILSMDSNAAKELMTSFLQRFSGVRTFMQRIVDETRNKGYAETICHRKRWFPQINSGNPHLKSYSERQAINFPIQGSAADICKCGMVQVVQILKHISPQTRLLLQIHDELLFEVPDKDVQIVSERIKATLESANLIPSCTLKVPLEVRVAIGKNWAALAPSQ